MPPKSPAKPVQSQTLGAFFTGIPDLPPPPTPVKKGSSKEKDNGFYTLEVTKKDKSPKASGSSKSSETSKHFGSTSTSKASTSSSTTMNKSNGSSSTSKPKPKSDPDVIVLSDDSDSDEAVPSTSAAKSKSKPLPPKRKSMAVSSSDDDDDEEEKKPATPKGKGKIGVKLLKSGDKLVKKAGKKADDSFLDNEDEDDEMDGGKSKSKAKASTSAAKKPPAKKVKKEEKEDDDADAPPKKKWVYKAPSGPANPGAKDVPEGKDNCLAGLTFVFTGEMSSFSREQMQDMAKRFGGRVTTAPSSKTSYVVLGTEAGPKKLEMIQKHSLKTLDEDGFLELIGKRPSGANDPKFIEQQEKQAKKIKDEAKKMALSKDAPEHKQQLWTVKYAPSKLTEICGNKGSVEKLSKWLQAWPKSLASDFKKPGPDAMGGFRCVLISGPPGIGKTTAAHLVAKLQGYNILELNASDVRSKKLLETAFQTTINNTTLSGFFKSASDENVAEPSVNQKSIIIMDEVDGMSSGDRGGVGALNALIRKTRVPIIAICNDKSAIKMKPLTATCFQMIFKRPSAPEIRGRMMTVAYKEGIKMEGSVMDQLVAGSQSDIRQIVNMLSTWKLGAKTMDFDEGKKLAKLSAKNSIATPWTLYSKLMAPQAFSPVSGMSLNDKLDIYFQDHSMMPLFVQQNYLSGTFSKASNLDGPDAILKKLELASKAADAISDGDLVDGLIHQGQQWSLMPVHGMFSCIRPAYFCHGPSSGYPAFSAWFGKNSTQGKLQRLLGEIQIRMRLRISGDRKEIRTSYIPTLWPRLVKPLQSSDGADAIDEVIALMDEYFLSKEDWDAIVELGVGEGFQNDPVLKTIDSKIKAAFTRKYNTTTHPVPFARHAEGGKVAKKITGSAAPDQEDVMLEDADDSEDEADSNSADDTDLTKDKMVKQKKAGKGTAKGKAKAAPKKK